MAHHHLAIAVLFIIAGHQYRTNFGIGRSMKEILEAHAPPAGGLSDPHERRNDQGAVSERGSAK
jgi:photosystem I P700 chlorophyll a apoprotein A2